VNEPTPSEPELVRERRGQVEIFRINRPEARNALNGAVMAGLGNGLVEADADPDVRAIILTATGDRAFCAGLDLRDFASGAVVADDLVEGRDRFRRFIREGVGTPLIGAANGTAVAGGFGVLLACDLIVCADTARFGLPEVKRGLFAAGGGAALLGRWIPPALALELTMTGDTIDAERALQLGVINRVVAGPRVLEEALDLAGRIVANGPLGVQATKRIVRAASQQTAAETWALQDELHASVFESADAKEGARAFVERRDPVWTGH
jgi:enoyl-CoA hydratase/carnithine racemase